MGGGKGGDPKMKVTNYYMSLHLGVCTGPVDAVKAIIVGEKVAWEGNRTTPGVERIDKPNLYGGLKKEGGLLGDVAFLLGGQTQVIPEDIATSFGETPGSLPAYRGITSLFFRGSIDWDGTFPDITNYIHVPFTGVTVPAGDKVIGFTVELSADDNTGLIVDMDYDVGAAGYDPDLVPQSAIMVNHTSAPPEDITTMPNDTALMLLRNDHTLVDSDTIEFTALTNSARVTSGAGTADSSSQQGGTLIKFFCVFDGATGVFTVNREGGGSVSQTLSPGEFILSRFEADSSLGTAKAVVTNDVSDPVFPAGVTPIGDVL